MAFYSSQPIKKVVLDLQVSCVISTRSELIITVKAHLARISTPGLFYSTLSHFKMSKSVSTGSQNGLEMLLGSLLNEGDGILTDDPMYPGTKAILRSENTILVSLILTIRPLGASIIPIKTDGDGMDTDDLETQIEKFKESHNLKVIMTVANGGNPTGSTLSLERRHRLLELAHANDLLVVEDDPYYFLQFDGEQLPSLFELDWNSSQNRFVIFLRVKPASELELSFKRVIRSDSFSKIISAGIRIGWITGPKEVFETIFYVRLPKLLLSGKAASAQAALYKRLLL